MSKRPEIMATSYWREKYEHLKAENTALRTRAEEAEARIAQALDTIRWMGTQRAELEAERDALRAEMGRLRTVFGNSTDGVPCF